MKKNMLKIFVIYLIALMIINNVFAYPYIGYAYPSSVQKGKEVTIILGGQNLMFSRAVSTTDKIKVLSVTKVPNIPKAQKKQRTYLIDCIKAIEAGKKELPEKPKLNDSDVWRKNPWLDDMGSLNDLEVLLVTEKVYDYPNPLQSAPAIAEKLLVTLKIDEDCQNGVYPLRFYSVRGVSNPIDIYVNNAEHYQEVFYKAPYHKAKEIVVDKLPATINGIIRVKNSKDEYTVNLKQGVNYTFKFTGRTLKPFIGDGVPGHFQATLTLLDSNDKVVAFADDYYYNPDPVLEFKALKSGKYKLVVKDSLSRGREDFVYFVDIFEGKYKNKEVNFSNYYKVLNANKYNHNSKNLLDISTDIVVKSELKSKQKDEFYFAGSAGDEIVISTKSLYNYSMLDTELKLYDANNKLIVQNDDYIANYNIGKGLRFTDSYIRIELPKSGVFKIEVSDKLNRGGENFKYLLSVNRKINDFMVYTTASHVLTTKMSPFQVEFIVNKSVNFPYDIEISSPQLKNIGSYIIEKDVNEKKLTFAPKLMKPNSVTKIQFVAKVIDDNGVVISQNVIPADEAMQAFAYDHYVLAEDFYIYQKAWQAKNKKKNKK